MQQLRAAAERRGDRHGVVEPSEGLRVVLRRGVGEMRPESDDVDPTLALGGEGDRDEIGPILRAGTVAVQPGIDLEVQTGPPLGTGHGGDRLDLPACRHPEVDTGGDRGRVVGVRPEQPGEEGHRDAGIAQGQSRGHLEHRERIRSGVERGPGQRHEPVPVGVGLDGEHRARGCDQLSERRDVVTEGGEIDLEARLAHAMTLSTRQPRLAVSVSAGRSACSAHSTAVGCPCAASPKITASSPTDGRWSPQSTTS